VHGIGAQWQFVALQGNLSFAGRLTAYPKFLYKCLILERLKVSVRVMAAFGEACGDGGLPNA